MASWACAMPRPQNNKHAFREIGRRPGIRRVHSVAGAIAVRATVKRALAAIRRAHRGLAVNAARSRSKQGPTSPRTRKRQRKYATSSTRSLGEGVESVGKWCQCECKWWKAPWRESRTRARVRNGNLSSTTTSPDENGGFSVLSEKHEIAPDRPTSAPGEFG